MNTGNISGMLLLDQKCITVRQHDLQGRDFIANWSEPVYAEHEEASEFLCESSCNDSEVSFVRINSAIKNRNIVSRGRRQSDVR